MSSSHLLTSYRQSGSSFPATSDNSARSNPQQAHPSFRAEDWISRPLPPHFITQTPTTARNRASISNTVEPPDLFATLLFDRGKAYDQTANAPAPGLAIFNRTSAPRTVPHNHSGPDNVASQSSRLSRRRNREPAFDSRRTSAWLSSERSESPTEGMSLVSHLRNKQAPPKVSKRRAKTPKKTTTKKRKMSDAISKKRPAQDDEGLDQRATKFAKTEAKANIGKKVENSNNNAIIEIPCLEIIEISDSEDEKPVIRNEEQSHYNHSTPESRSYDSPNPLRLRLRLPSSTTANDDNRKAVKVDSPDYVSDFTPALIGGDRDGAKATEELEKLREELQTEREKTANLERELENKNVALQENQKVSSEREQSLERKLQDEQRNARVATEQCEQLREQLRICQEDLVKQKQLEIEHHAQFTENERLRRAVGEENDCVREALRQSSNEVKDLSHQVQTLQDDKTRLTAEIETLKTAASPPSRAIPALSPVPSLCSSTSTSTIDEDLKTENVRKMYLKVNRQLVILQAVARSLVTCTRSMDLSSFGEFGKDMKKLRKALEVDESPQNSQESQAGFVGKADDEDDSGSQRSGG